VFDDVDAMLHCRPRAQCPHGGGHFGYQIQGEGGACRIVSLEGPERPGCPCMSRGSR
jgi:hypothetical protein